MTIADIRNMHILDQHAEEIAATSSAQGLQAAIDRANQLIDVSAGIVGGDGCYYPRAGFPQQD
jgi:hypothetical protein